MKGDLSSAAKSLKGAGDEVARLAHDLDGIIGGDHSQFTRLMNKTESSLDILEKTLTNVNDIAGDKQVRKGLKDSLAGLPENFHQMQKSMAMIQSTANLADKNLRNMEGFTKPLESGAKVWSAISTAAFANRRTARPSGAIQQAA